jgi:hypothetical protein
VQLVEGLLQGVPVFYNTVVTGVEYEAQQPGVRVATPDGVFQGEAQWVPLGEISGGKNSS